MVQFASYFRRMHLRQDVSYFLPYKQITKLTLPHSFYSTAVRSVRALYWCHRCQGHFLVFPVTVTEFSKYPGDIHTLNHNNRHPSCCSCCLLLLLELILVSMPLGTLSNEDGNANDDGSEKSYFWFALYFFVRAIRVLFSPLEFCEQK